MNWIDSLGSQNLLNFPITSSLGSDVSRDGNDSIDVTGNDLSLWVNLKELKFKFGGEEYSWDGELDGGSISWSEKSRGGGALSWNIQFDVLTSEVGNTGHLSHSLFFVDE